MKVGIVIYRIMDYIMLVASLALMGYGFIIGESFWSVLVMLAVIFVFAYFTRKNQTTDVPYKKLMNNIYCGHVLVVFAVIQMMVVFGMDVLTVGTYQKQDLIFGKLKYPEHRNVIKKKKKN